MRRREERSRGADDDCLSVHVAKLTRPVAPGDLPCLDAIDATATLVPPALVRATLAAFSLAACSPAAQAPPATVAVPPAPPASAAAPDPSASPARRPAPPPESAKREVLNTVSGLTRAAVAAYEREQLDPKNPGGTT